MLASTSVLSRYDFGTAEISGLLEGLPAYRTNQLVDGMYRRLEDPLQCTNLPIALRQRLSEMPELASALEPVREQSADQGMTFKWLFKLHDGSLIETVLMRYRKRSTVCVSSQAGCAMDCQFCATGQAGFTRQLSIGEIVEQVVRAARAAKEQGGPRLSNVVFMGMGEPMGNYATVLAACRRIVDEMGLSARGITISTVGLVPGIKKLAAEGSPFNLALSLHAANDDLRNKLIPLNRRWPLHELSKACSLWTSSTRRRLSLEWACMAGVNDSYQDMEELASFAEPLRAHVNLIPLNPTPGWPTEATLPERVHEMAAELSTLGINATVRHNRGTQIAAACGQLAAPATPGGTAATGRLRNLFVNTGHRSTNLEE